jgi:hypothetical protein
MRGLLNFFKYNNAVPIILGVVFIGAGSAFAATDPQAIYSQTQQVVSVDNTYIANKDLTTWTPKILITGVTEDADNYYVAYTFTTIDVVNYAWQDVAKNITMTVNKADLGQRDLGVYVTAQFRNIITNEVAYLSEVQDKAKNDISQKVVATTYGGLVGKFLDTSTETLPGYTPVVSTPIDTTYATSSATPGQPGGDTSGGSSGGSSTLLSLQVLGNNPARIALGAGYADLGVVLLDPTNPNIGYHAFVDGAPSDPPQIDTSTTSAHIIEYRATDQAGNTFSVTRVVLVGDAADPGGEVNTAGAVQAPPAAMPGADVIFDTPAPTSTVDTTPAPDATTTPVEQATSTGQADSSPVSADANGTSTTQ